MIYKHHNYKHGHKSRTYESPTYGTWKSMKKRCYSINHNSYKYYGERGIEVCERWKNSFINFLEDMGERPNGKTLDRIDVNGNYSLENCKWSTNKEQMKNRRSKVKVIDSLVGQKFGLLTVISVVPRELWKRNSSHWVCLCNCGKEKIIGRQGLQSGQIRSCGKGHKHSEFKDL